MPYSAKINDPRFAKYLKNTADYRNQFGFALSIIAVVGFYLYGELSDEMDNPEALYIGLTIGGLFFIIGLYAAFSRKKEADVEAEVVEKEIKKEHGRSYFIVYFEDQLGNKREIKTENDPTLYNYYRIGEKVKYHGHLKTYEKYDKSGDDIIFCNACSFMNDISEVTCRNCGCPLLK